MMEGEIGRAEKCVWAVERGLKNELSVRLFK